MAYTFSDRVTKPTSSRSNNRRRRETTSSSSHNHTSSSPSTATYTFENSSAVLSASEFHDGHSLTYSASSSQAGESTDSSLADIERMVERDQQLQMITNQNERHGNGHGHGHSSHSHSHSHSQHFIRQSSSLGYSTGTDDADFHEYHVHGRRGDNNSSHRQDLQQQQQYQSGNRFYRGQSPSGQQSASQGNDGGYDQSQNQRAMYKSTPNQNKHKSKKSSNDSFSPTTVSADISNGSAHTPPPRHVKRLSADDNNELWYQKWWMCGFTDAFSS